MTAHPLNARLSFFLCLAWLAAHPAAAEPTAAVTTIVQRVQASNTTLAVDSYGDFLRLMPVNQGDRRGYWGNRTAQGDLGRTRTVVHGQLVRLLGSPNVSYQDFAVGGYAGVNIIGVLPGVGAPPQRQYVIGAHYDAAETPGADDNASGVAGMLEAARVLRGSAFTGAILFVAFDQEEERANGWGKGSQVYANRARAAGANLRAMAGLDMLAYNHRGLNRATLSRCDSAPGTPGERLSNRMRTAFQDYSGLTVTQLTGENASDPYRFHQTGFPAVLVSEQFTPDGWPLNPYYHSYRDYYRGLDGGLNRYSGRPYVDLDYAASIVRGVVGWAATEAGYVGPRSTSVGP